MGTGAIAGGPTVTAPPAPELVADGLTYPTSLAFDDEGTAWVAEAGLAFGGAAPGGRVWRLASNGERQLVVENLSPPVNGLFHHEGSFFVSVGGQPSRIIRVWGDGRVEVVLEGLPGPGDYQTNMAVVGPDGWLYFSQGAMTNSGVIGLDSYQIGWLSRLPHSHDLPGLEVVLAGVNVVTADPRDGATGEVATGAFVPFGRSTDRGQRVPACLPCTAAVMRCRLDGSDLELVAWGVRNAYGLGFLGDGRLLAIDQGADDRGSRPIGNAPDLLHDVRSGAWFGWPDFVGDVAVTDPRFRPQSAPLPTFVLENHHELPAPARPLVEFPPHSAATKFAVAPADQGRWAGHLFVTLFGDEVPLTAPSGPRVGRGVVRVDPGDWSVHPLPQGPYLRPIDVGFHPGDGALYVLDFGRFEMTERGVDAEPATGRLWRLPALERLLSPGGAPS